jgi:L-amino acid ligase C-terminal domain 2/ATP-grasp domain
MPSDRPVVIFPDDKKCAVDRPCSFHKSLLSRADIVPVLLRPHGLRHSEEHLALTRPHLVIEVDTEKPPSITAALVADELAVRGHIATDFCCMSEPIFEYWSAVGRSLSLPAPSAATARAVRHKPTMKRKLDAAGLTVAPFLEFKSRKEVRAFAQRWGYPLVGKPVDGYGARLTEVLVNEADLESWMAKREPGNFMIEQWQSGTEIECCFLVHSGRASRPLLSLMPARPLDAAHGAINANISLASRRDLEPVKLDRLVQVVCDGLSIERGYVHMELFLGSDGVPIFGELALRYPGCEIANNHGRALNVDIDRLILDTYLGHKPVLPDVAGRCVGDLLLLRPTGEVVEVISEAELEQLPGVLTVHLALRSGQVIAAVEPASYNCAGWVIIDGDDPGEVLDRMITINRLFGERIKVRTGI